VRVCSALAPRNTFSRLWVKTEPLTCPLTLSRLMASGTRVWRPTLGACGILLVRQAFRVARLVTYF